MIAKKHIPNICIIIALFSVIFGSCLALFKIPIQSEAISIIPNIYYNITDFNTFILRSPIEKSTLYFLMKIAPFISDNYTSNIYFIFYLTYHLITAIVLYFFIQQLINTFKLKFKLNLALWISLLFLFQQTAIECFSGIAFATRLFGPLFILLNFHLKLSLLKSQKNYSVKIIGCIILSYIAFSFYETNCLFLICPFFFPCLSFNIFKSLKTYIIMFKKYLFALVIEGISICLIIISQYSLIQNAIHMKTSEFSHSISYAIKLFFLNIINIIIPNFHGVILIGNIIYTPIICIIIGLFFYILINKKSNHKQLIIFMSSFFLFCNFCFSLLPHYAPRVTYGYSIIMYAIIILIIEATLSQTSETTATDSKQIILRKKLNYLLPILLASTIINIYHFYYLQHKSYDQLYGSINKILDSTQLNNTLINIHVHSPFPFINKNNKANFEKYYKIASTHTNKYSFNIITDENKSSSKSSLYKLIKQRLNKNNLKKDFYTIHL